MSDIQDETKLAAEAEAVRQERERFRKIVQRDSSRRCERDRIYEGVRAGRLSPEAGDAEAIREGSGRLQTRPDASVFDPTTVSHWTLGMALAWIIWRTPDAVREHWDDYRAKRIEWGAWVQGAGRQLKPLPPVCRLTLDLNFANDTAAARHTPDKAEAELRDRLARALLSSDGVNVRTGDREPLPASGWRGVFDIVDHGPGLRVNGGSAAYRDVQLPREDIVQEFPLLDPAEAISPAEKVTSSIAPEKRSAPAPPTARKRRDDMR
jgi:hypothetical protein